MIDAFDELLLDPVYDTLGVEAVITPGNGARAVTMTVIDQTRGLAVSLGELGVPTAKPAAALRLSELETNRLARGDLRRGQILLNGTNWRIENVMPKPGPSGGGELYLLLTELKP